MKTIIWTRSVEDFTIDHPWLSELLPHDVAIEHVPCIHLVPRLVHLPAHSNWTHAVLTSPHAVTFALQSPEVTRLLSQAQTVYTHGASTLEALTHRGLKATRVGGLRTAEDLGAWLAAHLPQGAKILIPGTHEPAFDLAGFLSAKGWETYAPVCYETIAEAHAPDGTPLSSAQMTAVVSRTSQVVCFASPSAVRGFMNVFSGAALHAAVIGPTTAAAARPHFAHVSTARENSLRSLAESALTLLTRSVAGSPGIDPDERMNTKG